MEEKKIEDNKAEGKKTFMEKYYFLMVVLGIALIFIILKLIGFPDILLKK